MQKVKPKKIPLRMCAGCGEMKPKKELVRVVRAPVKEVDGVETGGEVSLDLTGRKPGRGAYVCRNPECLKKAQKARRFERALSETTSTTRCTRSSAPMRKSTEGRRPPW